MSTIGRIVDGIRRVRDKKRLEQNIREKRENEARREYQKLLEETRKKTRKKLWSSFEGEKEMFGTDTKNTYRNPRDNINAFGSDTSEEQEVQSANQTAKPAKQYVQPAIQTAKPVKQYVQPTNQSVEPVGQYPQSTFGKGKYQSFFPKYEPPANIKLTVILLENTDVVFTEEATVKKIIETSVKGGKFCIIDYSSQINWNKVKDDNEFTDSDIFTVKRENETINLYDAILYLAGILDENLNKRTSYHKKAAIINSLEIIGIGTACDTNFSKVIREEGIKTWKDILKKCKNTKYYCIDEKDVVRVAALGFRSIGVIHRVF